MSTIIRRDCAYCIDLQEQGALCDHPCTLYGGEPIDAVCNGCRRYERRMSTREMLDRIHALEKRLKESEFWREKYADEIIQLKPENAKLRELARHMGACIQHLDRTDEDGGCVRCPYQTVEHDCGFEQCMAELGIEVD